MRRRRRRGNKRPRRNPGFDQRGPVEPDNCEGSVTTIYSHGHLFRQHDSRYHVSADLDLIKPRRSYYVRNHLRSCFRGRRRHGNDQGGLGEHLRRSNIDGRRADTCFNSRNARECDRCEGVDKTVYCHGLIHPRSDSGHHFSGHLEHNEFEHSHYVDNHRRSRFGSRHRVHNNYGDRSIHERARIDDAFGNAPPRRVGTG